MLFRNLILTGIRDDILKSKIVISLELERTPENIKLCEELSLYAPTKDSSGRMTATFEPNQPPLFKE
jgi:hypothetical protein